MKVFIKRILSQEWGYRKGTPNKAGKYILIPKCAWDFFPDLSSGVRNAFCTITTILTTGTHIGLFYVWNNTKNFPEIGLKKNHNERRLYSSKIMENELQLDIDVLICFFKINSDSSDYVVTAVPTTSNEYSTLINLLGARSSAVVDSTDLQVRAPHTMQLVTSLLEAETAGIHPDTTIENKDELFDKLISQASIEAQFRDISENDPLLVLSATYKTQNDFSDVVRKIYEGKCALRESFLYKDHPIGLDAAHIHAKANGGNNLPSNGILLSTDLHRAFDEGVWTLSDDLHVIVHEKVKEGGLLGFHNKKLVIPSKHETFSPYVGYVRWHRKNRFGFFLRH